MPTPVVGRRFMFALATALIGILAGCSPSGPAGSTTGGAASASATAAVSSTTSTGGTAGASAAAEGPLACDVVTTQMIQQALGATVAAGTQAVLELGGSTCEFKDAGILVRVFPNQDAAFLQSMKGSFKGAVDLPGVGDAAFYSQQNATFMVLKGATVVQVQAPNQNDPVKLATLAAAIAAKL